MPNATYRARVLLPETAERRKYVEQAALGFVVTAPTPDEAARIARARIVENGFRVRSVGHSPGDVLNILVENKAVAS